MLPLVLLVLVAAVLVGVMVLMRRTHQELDSTVASFERFRNALRPALVRVETAAERARRRRGPRAD